MSQEEAVMDRQPPRRTRRAAPVAFGLGAVLVCLAALTGCSSGSSGKVTPAASSVASSAVSAAASAAASGASAAASALSSAVGGLGSAAASVLSSAAASAQSAAASALASVTAGLDATGDVTLGAVSTGSDGRLEVPVTVTNHQSQAYRYTIQVSFKDSSGNLLDTVVLAIPSVPAGQSAQATARSNRSLTGTVAASVTNALRY